MNKPEKIQKYRLMIAGVTTVVGTTETIPVKGVATATTDIVNTLQAAIDAPTKTATAEGEFHQAVADEKAANAKANSTYLGVKDFALVNYGNKPAVLAKFGIVAPQPKKPKVETKAAAAAKQRATRAKLGTKGKKQKKAALAAAPATPAVPSNGTTPKSS